MIARVRTDFPTKFGLPRQSGLVPELEGVVEFEEGFRVPEAVRGLEGFSHIWLLWGFSEGFASREENKDDRSLRWSPTVRPPRLGGNERMGVFATRSPNRPNPIGLSAVRLLAVDKNSPVGPRLRIAGIDMMDGTPVYDIKPYVAYADSVPEASGGFTLGREPERVPVSCPEEVQASLPAETWEALAGVLACDPRPRYHRDPDRVYGFSFAGREVRFTEDAAGVHVLSVTGAALPRKGD